MLGRRQAQPRNDVRVMPLGRTPFTARLAVEAGQTGASGVQVSSVLLS